MTEATDKGRPGAGRAPTRPARPGTGGFVISLDFELWWGVRDSRRFETYARNILAVREVVPRLLALFDRHGLACTWATVGMMFFDRREALLAALPERRPAYADARLDPYAELAALGADEAADPFRYGLSMIRRIAAAPDQEIGTHSFSHFYCLEPGQSEADFRADLAAAVAAARAQGIALRSIVFPRNQVNPAYLPACAEAGLIAFRGTERAAIYAAQARSAEPLAKRAGRLADAYLDLTGPNFARPRVVAGMVDVPSSRFLRPWSARLAALAPLRLRRILGAMRRAAAAGELFHLWFHPHNFGARTEENLAVMDRIGAEAARLRDAHGWPALTMAGAAERARAATSARSR